jgi:hypothetical protein
MNARHCCHGANRKPDGAPQARSRWRRAVEMVGWIIPSAMLVLMPKCPVCLAVDLALLGGVGISVANASRLRASLLVLCIAALSCLALRFLWRLALRKKGF